MKLQWMPVEGRNGSVYHGYDRYGDLVGEVCVGADKKWCAKPVFLFWQSFRGKASFDHLSRHAAIDAFEESLKE